MAQRDKFLILANYSVGCIFGKLSLTQERLKQNFYFYVSTPL